MKISELRIYAEVLEQGLDFKKYIAKILPECPIKNIYTKKLRSEIISSDSIIDRIRKVKDVDVLLTAICGNEEIPVLMVEYSTAVPADDHKMQRSDVYFWASIFKAPVLKICPANKGMKQAFGGGDKITDDYEKALAFNAGAMLYIIPWENIVDNDLLDINPEALSCIRYSDALEKLLKELLTELNYAISHESWYNSLYKKYETQHAALLGRFDKICLKNIFVDSSRFKWDGQRLIVKINRFGHAMDPDRGILYFVNMLVGAENVITEIQVNRSENFDEREGYKSLLDQAPHETELTKYIKDLIKTKHNVFDVEDALQILFQALNLPQHLLRKTGDAQFNIDDNILYSFLIKHPSMVAKSIFFLSTKLILTDRVRKTICTITWSNSAISKYRAALFSANYTPTSLERLSLRKAKEDIITYASILLYRKINCELLAVSYPGAQGDRCILTGTGRRVLRTYIDIIACQRHKNKITVFLEECKDDIAKSSNDINKLNRIKSDPKYYEGLKSLCRKLTETDEIINMYLSIGAKVAYIHNLLDVDYIFMFDIDNTDANHTRLHYAIAFVNTEVAEKFKPLFDGKGKAKGYIDLDPMYCISDI